MEARSRKDELVFDELVASIVISGEKSCVPGYVAGTLCWFRRACGLGKMPHSLTYMNVPCACKCC